MTLPCTLWFLDGARPCRDAPPERGEASAERIKNTVLFLDARHIYRQVDRAHREFTPEQIEFLASRSASIAANPSTATPSIPPASTYALRQSASEIAIRNPQYADIPGLSKVATLPRSWPRAGA